MTESNKNTELVKHVKLRHPFEHGGQTYTRLEFSRRPIVRDMMVAQKQGQGDPIENAKFLFASLCEVPPEVIELMDWADYEALETVYKVFTA